MVSRNTERPLRFVCFTDDPTGLAPRDRGAAASRRSSFRRAITGKHGEKSRSGSAICRPFRRRALPGPRYGRDRPDRRVLRLRAAKRPTASSRTGRRRARGSATPRSSACASGRIAEVYDTLMADPAGTVRKFPNSQTFASRTISSMAYWPAEWCLSFKHTLVPRWPLNFVKDAPLPPTRARHLLHRLSQSRPGARRRLAEQAPRLVEADLQACPADAVDRRALAMSDAQAAGGAAMRVLIVSDGVPGTTAPPSASSRRSKKYRAGRSARAADPREVRRLSAALEAHACAAASLRRSGAGFTGSSGAASRRPAADWRPTADGHRGVDLVISTGPRRRRRISRWRGG